MTDLGWEEADRAARDVEGVGGVEEVARRLDALEERLGVASHPDEGVVDAVEVLMFDMKENTVDEESPLLKRLAVLEAHVNVAEAKVDVAYDALVDEGLVEGMEWKHRAAERQSGDD